MFNRLVEYLYILNVHFAYQLWKGFGIGKRDETRQKFKQQLEMQRKLRRNFADNKII